MLWDIVPGGVIFMEEMYGSNDEGKFAGVVFITHDYVHPF